jgi:hypothetical protein
MPGPITITVTYTDGSGNAAAQTISIPSILQSLNSPQDAASQTGYDSFDILLQGITRRGGITLNDASGTRTFIPLVQVIKITAQ